MCSVKGLIVTDPTPLPLHAQRSLWRQPVRRQRQDNQQRRIIIGMMGVGARMSRRHHTH